MSRMMPIAKLVCLVCLWQFADAAATAGTFHREEQRGESRDSITPLRIRQAATIRSDAAISGRRTHRLLQGNDKNGAGGKPNDVPAVTTNPPTPAPATPWPTTHQPTTFAPSTLPPTITPQTIAPSLSLQEGSPQPTSTPNGADSLSSVTLLAFDVTLTSGAETSKSNDALLAAIDYGLESYLLDGFGETYSNVQSVILQVSAALDSTNTASLTGTARFDGSAPPASDLQALQKKLLRQNRAHAINKAVASAGGGESDADGAIETVTVSSASMTTTSVASPPTDGFEGSNKSISAAAAVGGGVAAAAVLMLAMAVFASRRSRRKVKTLHVSLEDESDEDSSVSTTSKRSAEMPCYDLEVQATGSQLILITSTASRDQPGDNVYASTKSKEHQEHQPQTLATVSRDDEENASDDDAESFNYSDGYSLASYVKNNCDDSPPSTRANLSMKGMPTFVPVTPGQSSSYIPQFCPGSETDEDDDREEVYMSDNDSIFTQGKAQDTHQSNEVVHSQPPQPDSLLSPPEQSLRCSSTASHTVVHANTTGRHPSYELYSNPSSAFGVYDSTDSDAELDELMGPMPQVGKSESKQQEKSLKASSFSGAINTLKRPSKKKKQVDQTSSDDSSQPSDEAMDERDRDLAGFALELEAARSGTMKHQQQSEERIGSYSRY